MTTTIFLGHDITYPDFTPICQYCSPTAEIESCNAINNTIRYVCFCFFKQFRKVVVPIPDRSRLLNEANLIDLSDAAACPRQASKPFNETDLNMQPVQSLPPDPVPSLIELQMLEMLKYLSSRT